MNAIEIIRLGLNYTSYAFVAAVALFLVALLLRRPLRVLYGHWRNVGLLGRVMILLFVTVFVLYGGSKQPPPSSTNEPPGSQYGPLFSSEGLACLSQSLQPTTNYQSPTTISRWNARGTWEDWQRIDLPSGFAFPMGTNAVTSFTLMSQGSLRTSLTNVLPFAALPYRVSLEPGASSVSYGLTPSNSFLIAWTNACVERDATNRVNASIELFASGDTLVTLQPTTSHQSPTTIFTPAPLPEGYVGEGQNLAWATNAFPNAVSNILASGYTSWLENEYVGINEQNGHYQAKLTITELPVSGPCYLECGPYKVVVTEPGTYCFPLEVFRHYAARTYPTPVAISVEYDDGYRGDATMQSSSPSLQASAPWGPGLVDVCMVPSLHVSPSTVALSEATNKRISLWCNVANVASRTYRSLSGLTYLVFRGTDADILRAAIEDRVTFVLRAEGYEISEILDIIDMDLPEDPDLCWICLGADCPCSGHCSAACSCHVVTNGVLHCSGTLP